MKIVRDLLTLTFGMVCVAWITDNANGAGDKPAIVIYSRLSEEGLEFVSVVVVSLGCINVASRVMKSCVINFDICLAK